MSPPPVVVAICSVPWRRENLIELLGDLSRQTRKPDRVLLTLDGYSSGIPKAARHDLDIIIRTNPEPRGAGERWRWLDGFPADVGTALVIDDDFRLDENYIERTMYELAHAGLRTNAIAWSGARESDGEYLPWTITDSHELYSISAGTCAVPLQLLRGVTDYPFAQEYLTVGGDDEALVSYHLWRQAVRMTRPMGRAPLRSIDSLQDGERATWRTYGFSRVEQRMKLAREQGWTPFKLPPNLARTGENLGEPWKKKPWQG